MDPATPAAKTELGHLVVVQEMNTSQGVIYSHSPQPRANWIARCKARTKSWLRSFFPWVGESRQAHVGSRVGVLFQKASIALIGLLCLLGALSTVLFSFLVLYFIDDKPEKQSKFLQPASWLSAILSADSILLHVALLEGVAIAWWYRATCKDVIHEQLHETWRMGTSLLAVLRSGSKFNYVAMAFIFVATVPLNGFLLQNAVFMYSAQWVNTTDLHLPYVPRLPSGFSADMNNGTLGSWSQELISVTSSWESSTQLPPGVFYPASQSFGLIGCANKDNSAVCKTQVTMAGFNMTCETAMSESYDLDPSGRASDLPYTVRVFSSQVTWDPSTPELIGLNIMYKPNQTCQGQFERTSCQLRAAQMLFPLQISSDRGFYLGTGYESLAISSPVLSLDATASSSDFEFRGELPGYQNEGQNSSTYGGIAQWLGERFDGSIDWTMKDGSWSSSSTGTLAKTYRFMPFYYHQNLTDGAPLLDPKDDTALSKEPFNPQPDNSSWCQNVYQGLDWISEGNHYDSSSTYYSSYYSNITETVFLTLNQFMMGASVVEAATQWNNNETFWNSWWDSPETDLDKFSSIPFSQTFPAIPNVNQTQYVLHYHVRYEYYGASAAITVTVVLMILPLFYGFWRLEHKVTLSPFETAAAFNAPSHQGVNTHKDVNIWLQEIGRRPVHTSNSSTSLLSVPPPSYPTPALRTCQ